MSADLTLVHAYSEALFQAGIKAGKLDEAAQQSLELYHFFEKQARLRVFFSTPSISNEDKEALFTRLFGGRLIPLVENFVRMLIKRGRLPILFDALKSFHDKYRAHLGIAGAIVTTAVKLDDALRKKVEERLCSFMDKKLLIQWKVDPSIVGGLRFLSGDTLVDRTVERGLDELRTKLNAAQVF